MAWERESFTPEQRRSAAKAIVRAQGLVGHLDRTEYGPDNAEIVAKAYGRVDDMLAMLYDDIYGLGAVSAQWPSTS
jgi:hypothetical protein